MDTAILVIRWIGLGGALLFTLVILKEVALVLRTLAHIRSLAEAIRDAARGMRTHLEAGAGLTEVEEPLKRLRLASADLHRSLANAGGHLAASTPAPASRQEGG